MGEYGHSLILVLPSGSYCHPTPEPSSLVRIANFLGSTANYYINIDSSLNLATENIQTPREELWLRFLRVIDCLSSMSLAWQAISTPRPIQSSWRDHPLASTPSPYPPLIVRYFADSKLMTRGGRALILFTMQSKSSLASPLLHSTPPPSHAIPFHLKAQQFRYAGVLNILKLCRHRRRHRQELRVGGVLTSLL